MIQSNVYEKANLIGGWIIKCKIILYNIGLYFLDCSPGKYGPRCLYRCTGNCLNDKACNVTTGKCDDGCKPGYTGDMCDTGISKQSDIC